MSKVATLNNERQNLTVEEALQKAAASELHDVLILGYGDDGELVLLSSYMTNCEALWMLETAKKDLLG